MVSFSLITTKMKIAFSVIFACFLFSTNSFCQTVTIQELINKTECRNVDCFNSYIKEKGFSPDNTVKKPNGIKMYACYNADKSISVPTNENVSKPNYSCYTKISEGITKIDFGTSIKSNYRSLLAELDTLNFKPIKSSGEANKQIIIYYNSNQYPIIKVIVKATGEVGTKGEGGMSYLFEICRN